jgi:hypothetical protein
MVGNRCARLIQDVLNSNLDGSAAILKDISHGFLQFIHRDAV